MSVLALGWYRLNACLPSCRRCVQDERIEEMRATAASDASNSSLLDGKIKH